MPIFLRRKFFKRSDSHNYNMKIRFLIPLTEVIGIPPRWIIRTKGKDTLPMQESDVIMWRLIHPGKIAYLSFNQSEFVPMPSHQANIQNLINQLKVDTPINQY